MKPVGEVAVAAALCAATGILLWTALSFAPNTRAVPIIIAIPTLALLLAQLMLDLRRLGGDLPAPVGRGRDSFIGREIAACAIVCAVVLGVDLLGLAVGLALGLMTLLSLRARVAIPQAALVAMMAFFAVDIGFGRLLGLLLPQGRLWGWLGL